MCARAAGRKAALLTILRWGRRTGRQGRASPARFASDCRRPAPPCNRHRKVNRPGTRHPALPRPAPSRPNTAAAQARACGGAAHPFGHCRRRHHAAEKVGEPNVSQRAAVAHRARDQVRLHHVVRVRRQQLAQRQAAADVDALEERAAGAGRSGRVRRGARGRGRCWCDGPCVHHDCCSGRGPPAGAHRHPTPSGRVRAAGCQPPPPLDPPSAWCPALQMHTPCRHQHCAHSPPPHPPRTPTPAALQLTSNAVRVR